MRNVFLVTCYIHARVILYPFTLIFLYLLILQSLSEDRTFLLILYGPSFYDGIYFAILYIQEVLTHFV